VADTLPVRRRNPAADIVVRLEIFGSPVPEARFCAGTFRRCGSRSARRFWRASWSFHGFFRVFLLLAPASALRRTIWSIPGKIGSDDRRALRVITLVDDVVQQTTVTTRVTVGTLRSDRLPSDRARSKIRPLNLYHTAHLAQA